ncbi:TetR family transcriptional regulator [Streptomyces sp. NPDC005244]|uniref:TetR family transcriptional regulator n=1 Tax=Streptomyces sp. NPDC005244 TaxID=3364708 RepID=UPI003681A98A
MAKQDRARASRAALLHAAAKEFAHNGYAGASMARVADGAGLSTGAVTFHFETKDGLAKAVVDDARTVIVAVLKGVVQQAPSDSATDQLGAAVLALVGALQHRVEIRAAVRLEQERNADAGAWSAAWQPLIQELAKDASRSGGLSSTTSAEDVAALAAVFLHGLDMHHRISTPEAAAVPVVELFGRLWPLVRRGMACSDLPANQAAGSDGAPGRSAETHSAPGGS